jgi:hypothetical protein
VLEGRLRQALLVPVQLLKLERLKARPPELAEQQKARQPRAQVAVAALALQALRHWRVGPQRQGGVQAGQQRLADALSLDRQVVCWRLLELEQRYLPPVGAVGRCDAALERLPVAVPRPMRPILRQVALLLVAMRWGQLPSKEERPQLL